MEKKRLLYLDAAKGWGINMIVFGHITAIGNPIDKWFGAYKIAVFFFVSGYLIALNGSLKKYSPREYMIRHARNLMLPYIGYSLLIGLYRLGVDFYLGKSAAKTVYAVKQYLYAFVTLRGHSTMWFLPCLFLAQIFFLFAWRTPRWTRLALALLSVGSNLFFHSLLIRMEKGMPENLFLWTSYPILSLSRAIYGFTFVCAGYTLWQVMNRFSWPYLRFLLGAALSLFTFRASAFLGTTDVNNMFLGKKPVLMMICGVTGSLGLILILEFLEKWWRMDYLVWSGKNSMIIMATHGTFRFKNVQINGWKHVYRLAEKAGLRYYLESIGIQVHLMLLECGVVTLVNRYLPVLAGKGFKRAEDRK